MGEMTSRQIGAMEVSKDLPSHKKFNERVVHVLPRRKESQSTCVTLDRDRL